MNTRLLTLTLVAGLAVVACDRSTPTQPSSSAFVLQSATVSVDGVVVNGTTVARGHGAGADGHGSMMNGGRMTLYDDGTHGDRMPNDGIYCYEDFGGEYGCHGANSPTGRHDYDFFGMDPSGGETNHMLVTVTVG